MTTPDSATATTLVRVAADKAFRIFTEAIDRWWRRGPRYRHGLTRSGTLAFEHDSGDDTRRLVERSGETIALVGRVTRWQPGELLAFEWHAPDLAEFPETTEVVVRFAAEGEGCTRVTIEHRGWSALAADHPARRDLSGEAFSSMVGLYWGDLLVRFVAAATADATATRS
ncbi:MAG: SRPBCC domain-containing protein [Myxococcales bacterium]|nr:SRPBCC domain-containing protein [Myxococcales bacterium]